MVLRRVLTATVGRSWPRPRSTARASGLDHWVPDFTEMPVLAAAMSQSPVDSTQSGCTEPWCTASGRTPQYLPSRGPRNPEPWCAASGHNHQDLPSPGDPEPWCTASGRSRRDLPSRGPGLPHELTPGRHSPGHSHPDPPNSGLRMTPRRCFSSSPQPTADDQEQKPVVGFIGLGNMGLPMASNLLKAGYPLVVFDSKEAAMAAARAQGAEKVGSAGELTQCSDIVITMLPSPAHVLEVYRGAKGLLHAPQQPLRTALFIDSSTVDPATARSVAGAARDCRISPDNRLGWSGCPKVLDAPVSGGVPGARAGTLAFMVGGEKAAFEAAGTILGAMGKKAMYCGPAGTGSAAKLCNNLALAIQMAGVAEALALGQKLGLDPGLLSSVFNSSSARSWSSDSYNPAPGVLEGVPSSNHYDGGFTCSLMLKDLNLATEAAQQVNGQVPVGSQVREMYISAVSAGLQNRDFSIVYRHIYGGKPSTK